MSLPPKTIGGDPVVAWTTVDARHRPTGSCHHLVAGELVGAAAALAICQGEEGFYLFGCDLEWQPITDTWHATIEEAKQQAEFEYEGVAATWNGSNKGFPADAEKRRG
jgi:hypothetical protein